MIETSKMEGAPATPRAAGITFRAWRGFDDLPAMTAVNDAVRRRAGILEPVDLDDMRHYYTHMRNCDAEVDLLLAERDGDTVAYARIAWVDMTDGTRLYAFTVLVHPDATGLGLGEAFVAWAATRAAAQAAAQPTDRPAHIGTYAYAEDEELESALTVAGYGAVHWSAEMLRGDLRDLPDDRVPDGYVIRTPDPSELPSVFDLIVLAFDATFGEVEGGDRTYEEWLAHPAFRRDLVVVAFRDGEPVAVVDNQLHGTGDGSLRGLLDSVGTHPDHRRRGLARATIARSLRILRDAGATSAFLSVDTANADRAFELYEACGFRRASTGVTYRRPFAAGAAQ